MNTSIIPVQGDKPTYYHFPDPITAMELLEKAAEVIGESLVGQDAYTDPDIFAVIFLDNQNRLIEYQQLFYGTVNEAFVYPRVSSSKGQV